MGKKLDVEDILDSVLDIMTNSGALNATIAAVEAEKTAAGKGLTPTLAAIPSNGYYQQTWTDKILQTSPAIFYGCEDVSVVPGGGGTAKTYKIFVEIVYTDNGQTNDTHKRISRYSRALEELFQEKFQSIDASLGLIKIESVRPIAFKLQLDSDEEIKVGGISLTITLY